MEQATTEKALTRKVLQDLNHQYHNQFNLSFVDSVLVNCKEVPISKKTLKSEKKQILRRCRDHINQQFRENAALTLLSEDESLRSYQRKRLAQSFECATPLRKNLTHLTGRMLHGTHRVFSEISRNGQKVG